MIHIVIIKPTKDCNADCSYCGSPPDSNGRWDINTFKAIFKTLSYNLADDAILIWHGGEPMLQGPSFYKEAYNYARSIKPNIRFSIQTNLLLYKESLWKDVFVNVFKGSVSTSFELDEKNRTVNGDAKKYAKQFRKKLKEVTEIGVHPLVNGVYSNATKDQAYEMFEWALNYQKETGKNFDIRANYVYPAGRASDKENFSDEISPDEYLELLLNLYEKWKNNFTGLEIKPISEMFQKTIGTYGDNSCPWTNKCAGTFLEIEPNGDLYNCGDFSDLQDKQYSFGNIIRKTYYGGRKENLIGLERIETDETKFAFNIFNTPAARAHKRRQHVLPKDCIECHNYRECGGGCHRDAVIYERGMGGKFYFCKSWMGIFDEIKKDVIDGNVDHILDFYNVDREQAIRHILSNEQYKNYIEVK